MNFIFILMCIVYGLCAIYFATKNDYTTICFFLTTILFQNIIVILFSDTASSMWITIFSLIKEGMLYLSIVLYVIKGKKNRGKKKRRDPCIFYCCNFCKEFICYRGIYFSSDNFTETVSYPLFRRECRTKS